MIPDHYLRQSQLSDIIPVLSYDDENGLFLLEDKAVAFGFVSPPLPGADPQAADRLQIMLASQWPKGTMIQILMTSMPDITYQVHEYQRERADAVKQARNSRASQNFDPAKEKALRDQEELIINLAKRQAEFWTAGAAKQILPRDGLRVNDSNIIITVRYPISGHQPTADEIIEIKRGRDSVEATLKNVGLAPSVLNANLWIRIMSTILCQSPHADWRDSPYTRWDQNETLNKQCLDPGMTVEIKKNVIDLGHDRTIKFLCVKRLPEYVYFGIAREYTSDIRRGSRGIRDNNVVFATIYYGDQEGERTKAAAERTWVTHQAFGPMLKFSPKLAAQKHSHDALGEALDDGDRVLHVYFGVMLICDKGQESGAVASAISFLRERHFMMLEDAHVMLPALSSVLPLCADPKTLKGINRFKRMAGRHAVNIVPIMGDWKGSSRPAMTFISRSGQMMFMSPFDSPQGYNALTIGGTGGGKSFLNNFFVTSILSTGGRVWVIDIGKSYLNLCENLGGQYIHFGKDSMFCLNPFELVQDYPDESDVLLGIVLSMAFQTDSPDDFQISGVRKVMNDLWNEHRNLLMIDHIANELLAHADSRLSDIGSQLFAFTSKGDFGRYFNGKNTVDLNNKFVLIELDELKSRPHLQKVILLQLIYQISQECYLGDRGQQKAMLVDEGWQLLAGSTKDGKPDAVLTFLEGAYRRFRKYGASCNIITQGLDELFATPNGAAIVANSHNMYFIRQKTDVVERAKDSKKMSMSDGAFELLKSITTVPGEYSEIFFSTENGLGIGRLIVDPYTRVLYSTIPADVQAIKDAKARGYSTDEAIRLILGESIPQPAAISIAA